ncbi:MAG: hypothetical protein AVDCRST_MAG68-5314, partial [uncultured Gemmatimonadetes bacterium]
AQLPPFTAPGAARRGGGLPPSGARGGARAGGARLPRPPRHLHPGGAGGGQRALRDAGDQPHQRRRAPVVHQRDDARLHRARGRARAVALVRGPLVRAVAGLHLAGRGGDARLHGRVAPGPRPARPPAHGGGPAHGHGASGAAVHPLRPPV